MKKINGELLQTLINYDLDAAVYDEVTSTNDVAKTIDRGVVVAAKQTAGRGRMGRKFFSGEGGLYLSLSLPICGGRLAVVDVPFSPGALTVAAGIAVCKVLIGYGLDAQIKWVNDVYVGGKKVCGILAERAGDKAILGIGVNLASDIPSELSGKAASLNLNCDFNKVAADIVNGVISEMKGPDIDFLNSHCLTVGKAVKTAYGVGKAVGVDNDGALMAEIDGEIKRVFYGEAEIVQ